MLEVKGISRRFGRRVILDGIDLTLSAGQHLLLTGPSGAGKSTLLRIIAGLETAESGVVTIEGQIATDNATLVVPPHRRGVSFVFQDLGLWPSLNASGNVLLALSGQRLSRRERHRRAEEALAEVGLQAFARAKPWELSGGEQQRLALARALAIRPKLLLLDEPFNALDLVLKQAIVKQLRQLAEAGGMAVILVSHQIEDASVLDAEVAVLEDGKIQEHGRTEDLVVNPRSRTLSVWKSSRGPTGRIADTR
jgi:iron(III) transport system ATP-binding protein